MLFNNYSRDWGGTASCAPLEIEDVDAGFGAMMAEGAAATDGVVVVICCCFGSRITHPSREHIFVMSPHRRCP